MITKAERKALLHFAWHIRNFDPFVPDCSGRCEIAVALIDWEAVTPNGSTYWDVPPIAESLAYEGRK